MANENLNANLNNPNGNTDNGPRGFKKWLPLIVLSLALAIIVLDTTILNVSLRTIIGDLHTDIQSIQWVITAYTLMLAAFTITGGRLGDLFGRKKMFILGAVIFAVGSFITSISKSVGMMIWGEAIIEGIGAAIMLPATSSLLVSNYKGRDRQIGFGIWGGIAAASAAFGPVFGGWLTTAYSWRWAFRINVAVAAVLVLASFLIKEYKDYEHKPTIDFVGAVLSALGMLSVVFGLIKSEDYGWWNAKQAFVAFGHTYNFGGISATPIFVLIGLIILALFWFWELRLQKAGKTPLVSPKLFKNAQFSTGVLIITMITLGLAGISFTLPVFFQAVKNLDALHTGLAMLPMSLTLLVSAPLSAYISKYISPKHLIQIGLVLTGIGFFVLSRLFSADGSQWHIMPGLILFGLGMGFIFSQSNNITLSAVPVQEAGEASGVSNTFRQLGSTLGAAILGAILISTVSTQMSNKINASAIIPPNAKAAINNSLVKQTSNIEFGSGVALLGNVPASITDEIKQISRESTVNGNKATAEYAIIFITLAFLISFRLPGGLDIEHSSAAAGYEPQTAGQGEEAGVVAAALETDPVKKPEPIVQASATSKSGSFRDSGYRPRRPNYTGPVIFALILAAVAGAIGYKVGKDRGTQQTPQQATTPDQSQTSVAQGDRGNQNTGGPGANLGSVSPNPAPKPAPAPAPKKSSGGVAKKKPKTPAVLGANTGTGTTNIPPRGGIVSTHIYNNPAMHFSVQIPDDWRVSTSPNEILFSTPDHVFYSVQLYSVSAVTDLNFISQQLGQQANVHNVAFTNFAGNPAVSFDIDGNFKHGFAIVRDGKLYYILGVDAANQLSSFRID